VDALLEANVGLKCNGVQLVTCAYILSSCCAPAAAAAAAAAAAQMSSWQMTYAWLMPCGRIAAAMLHRRLPAQGLPQQVCTVVAAVVPPGLQMYRMQLQYLVLVMSLLAHFRVKQQCRVTQNQQQQLQLQQLRCSRVLYTAAILAQLQQ
jgi:hypothetical protein